MGTPNTPEQLRLYTNSLHVYLRLFSMEFKLVAVLLFASLSLTLPTVAGRVVCKFGPCEIPPDTKVGCNRDSDCRGIQFNEKCHTDLSGYLDGYAGYCGSRFCDSEDDCLTIGNIYHGAYHSKGCFQGQCLYRRSAIIAK